MTTAKKPSRKLHRARIVPDRLAEFTAYLKEAGCIFNGIASEITIWRDASGATRRVVAFFGPGERFNMSIGKRDVSTSFSISLQTEVKAA